MPDDSRFVTEYASRYAPAPTPCAQREQRIADNVRQIDDDRRFIAENCYASRPTWSPVAPATEPTMATTYMHDYAPPSDPYSVPAYRALRRDAADRGKLDGDTEYRFRYGVLPPIAERRAYGGSGMPVSAWTVIILSTAVTGFLSVLT